MSESQRASKRGKESGSTVDRVDKSSLLEEKAPEKRPRGDFRVMFNTAPQEDAKIEKRGIIGQSRGKGLGCWKGRSGAARMRKTPRKRPQAADRWFPPRWPLPKMPQGAARAEVTLETLTLQRKQYLLLQWINSKLQTPPYQTATGHPWVATAFGSGLVGERGLSCNNRRSQGAMWQCCR